MKMMATSAAADTVLLLIVVLIHSAAFAVFAPVPFAWYCGFALALEYL